MQQKYSVRLVSAGCDQELTLDREYYGRLLVSRVHDVCIVSDEILLKPRSNLSNGRGLVSCQSVYKS